MRAVTVAYCTGMICFVTAWNTCALCQVEQGMFQVQQVLQVSQVLYPKPIHSQDLHDTYLLEHPIPQQVVRNFLFSLHCFTCEI